MPAVKSGANSHPALCRCRRPTPRHRAPLVRHGAVAAGSASAVAAAASPDLDLRLREVAAYHGAWCSCARRSTRRRSRVSAMTAPHIEAALVQPEEQGRAHPTPPSPRTGASGKRRLNNGSLTFWRMPPAPCSCWRGESSRRRARPLQRSLRHGDDRLAVASRDLARGTLDELASAAQGRCVVEAVQLGPGEC
jgi:hypothetical protein